MARRWDYRADRLKGQSPPHSDILFIEAPFAGEDAALAAERAHLTTVAAGEIARAAQVRHVEPFHFSPRYAGQEQRMMAEVAEAFVGEARGRGDEEQ